MLKKLVLSAAIAFASIVSFSAATSALTASAPADGSDFICGYTLCRG